MNVAELVTAAPSTGYWKWMTISTRSGITAGPVDRQGVRTTVVGRPPVMTSGEASVIETLLNDDVERLRRQSVGSGRKREVRLAWNRKAFDIREVEVVVLVSA
jgi:hypothetical protein